MDITDAECKFCIAHANCTWDGYNYTHYCLGKGICEVGCGNEEEGLANAKHIGRIMLGRIMGVPLLYRWKAMDMALAYATRGRKFLDLLLGVLRRMWSPKNLSDAVRSGELAADFSELAGPTKTMIKANSIIKSFEADPGGNLFVRASIMTGPLQSCLSKVMVADRNVTKLTDARAGIPQGVHAAQPEGPGPHPDPDMLAAADVRELEGITAKGNADFLSSLNGQLTVEEFTAMLLDLDHHTGWRRLAGDQQMLCIGPMICSSLWGWKRLVFYFQDPRFSVFECVYKLENGSSDSQLAVYSFDRDAIANWVDGCRDFVRANCSDCLDTAVAKECVELLTYEPNAGSRHLYEVLTILRIGSGICERQHLLGQALKRSKSRGIARDGYRLAQHTYRASVVGEAKRISDKRPSASFCS